MELADRIRFLVKKHPKSRKQIASDLFISTDSLGNYINGRRCPDASMIRKMALYFHVSADYLLCITETEEEMSGPPTLRQEQQLLVLFRSMSASQREDFFRCGFGITHFPIIQKLLK